MKTLHRLYRWLSVISPVDYLFWLYLVLVAILLTYTAIHGGDSRKAWENASANLEVWGILVSGLCGGTRALCFHPVEIRSYGKWLSRSPWKYPQPLPLGPMHLVWQDVLIVGVQTAIYPADIFPRYVIPASFLMIYCFVNCLSLWRVRLYWPIYAVLFLLGGVILSLPHAWVATAMVGLMYPVVLFGNREMLKRFPFSETERERLKLAEQHGTTAPSTLTTGCPVLPADPKKWQWGISYLHAALISGLVGWLVFSIVVLTSPEETWFWYGVQVAGLPNTLCYRN